MKTILIALLSFILFPSFAQKLKGGVDLNDMQNIGYVRGYVDGIGLSNSFRLNLDYGNSAIEVPVVREDNKPIQFKSAVNALNYMRVKGWRVINITQAKPVGVSEIKTYYLFERVDEG